MFIRILRGTPATLKVSWAIVVVFIALAIIYVQKLLIRLSP